MKGPTAGLSQQPGRSWGQPGLGGARPGGSSPDNDGTGRHCQTARVRQARQDGATRSEPVVEPPQAAEPARTWRMWAGQQRTPPTGEHRGGWRLRTSRPLRPRRPRGRPAAYPWRGCRGKAGHHPCRPAHGERGKRPDAPFPAVRPARRRAGPPSAGGIRTWRSPRGTRRPGEPATGGRGTASSQPWDWQARRSLVNTSAPWPTVEQAEARVLGIQTKLHQWATDDPLRRFDDLFNLVGDPAFLLVAWRRVRGNKGARTAGVDGRTARDVEQGRGVEAVLADLRAELRARRFAPLPVRERLIPKPGGKLRRLGIATIHDRVVQAACKLVLEPILEADFRPCSYGFRPGRRAQDAIEEIRYLAARSYEWVLEADITACFDELSHVGIMDRLRQRIADRRVLALVKAFLKAGILGEDGGWRETTTGAPQGGILPPLLSNLALAALGEHAARARQAMGAVSQRHDRRQRGEATWRLIRYADDFVVMVAGTRAHAEALTDEVAAVLASVLAP